MFALILSVTLGAGHMLPNTSDLIESSFKTTQVIGHRGAAAYSRENSLPAFRAAIASGAAVTECDIRISADGVPMVIHDATLNRTTSLKGAVADYKAADMMFAGVPTLEQVCQEVKGRILLAVEIKGDSGGEQAVLDVLSRADMLSQSMIFSSNTAIIRKVEEIMPKMHTVWLCGQDFTEEELQQLDSALSDSGADSIGFSYAGLSKPVVQHLKKKRRAVFVWTVPPGQIVDQIAAMGVNFIITNHPNEIIRQLKSRK